MQNNDIFRCEIRQFLKMALIRFNFFLANDLIINREPWLPIFIHLRQAVFQPQDIGAVISQILDAILNTEHLPLEAHGEVSACFFGDAHFYLIFLGLLLTPDKGHPKDPQMLPYMSLKNEMLIFEGNYLGSPG